MPNSRARRSSRRFSHPEYDVVASERSRDDFDAERPIDGFDIPVGRDSPRMTERRASSIPMKSRINRRVTRCQNDSLASSAGLLTFEVSSSA